MWHSMTVSIRCALATLHIPGIPLNWVISSIRRAQHGTIRERIRREESPSWFPLAGLLTRHIDLLNPDLRVVGPCIVSVKIGKSVVDTDLAAGVGAAIKTIHAVAQLGSRAVPL